MAYCLHSLLIYKVLALKQTSMDSDIVSLGNTTLITYCNARTFLCVIAGLFFCRIGLARLFLCHYDD